MLTQQQVFDKVVNHLLTQKKKSIDDLGCCYLNPDGLMCAVGCLIPQGQHEPWMEGQGVSSADEEGEDMRKILRAQGVDVEIEVKLNDDNAICEPYSQNLKMLVDLQHCHDMMEPPLWADRLRLIAADYNLNTLESDRDR